MTTLLDHLTAEPWTGWLIAAMTTLIDPETGHTWITSTEEP